MKKDNPLFKIALVVGIIAAVGLIPLADAVETIWATDSAPLAPAWMQDASTQTREETTKDFETHVVTLPTGDTVFAEVRPDGPLDVSVDFLDREDGTQPGTVHIQDGGDVYVIPDDAHIESDEDREAFNVASLLGLSGTQSTDKGAEPASEHQEHTLTLERTELGGEPYDGRDCNFAVINMEDRGTYSETCSDFEDGIAVHEVPAGTYAAIGIDRNRTVDAMTFLGEPALDVTDDTTLEMDASKATEITLDLEEEADTWPREKHMVYMVVPEDGASYKNSHGMWGHADFYTTGSENILDTGQFFFTTKWEMDAPERLVGGFENPDAESYEGPNTFYFLPFTMEAPIPEDLAFTLEDTLVEETAQVPVTIHANEEASSATGEDDDHYRETRHHWSFDPALEGSFARINHVSVPMERTEIITADEFQRYSVAGDPDNFAKLTEPVETYDAGERPSESYFAEPLAPGLIQPEDEYHRSSDEPDPTYRDGDRLHVSIPSVLDGDNHAGWADDIVYQTLNRVPVLIAGAWAGLTTDFTLYVDGEESPQTEAAWRPQGTYQVDAQPATYDLEVETAADGSDQWAMRAFETHTVWTFDSERPSEGQEVLPLLMVDYDLGLDAFNTLPAGEPTEIFLSVSHQPGATVSAIETPTLKASYDEGGTWQPVALEAEGPGGYSATLTPDEEATTLSLRTSIADEDGNALEQEMIRAAGVS